MTDNTKNLKIRLDGEINVSVTPQGLPAETPQAVPAPVAPTPIPEPERPADPVVAPTPVNAAPVEDTDHTQMAPEQPIVAEAQPEPVATDDGILYDDDDGDYEDVAPEAVQVAPVQQTVANTQTPGYFTTTRQATSGIDEYPVLTVACETNGVRTTIASLRQQVEHSLGLDEGTFRPYINGRIAQDSRAPNVGDSVIWLEDSKNRASA